MKILLLSLACMSTLAHAALPPYHQSQREINAVMSHPKVISALAPHAITSIEKKEYGYKIGAGYCWVNAEVEYIASEVIGPLNFKVEVNTPAYCAD